MNTGSYDIPGLDRLLSSWEELEDEKTLSLSARHVALLFENRINAPADARAHIEHLVNLTGGNVLNLLDIERGSPEDIQLRRSLQEYEAHPDDNPSLSSEIGLFMAG